MPGLENLAEAGSGFQSGFFLSLRCSRRHTCLVVWSFSLPRDAGPNLHFHALGEEGTGAQT